MQYSSTATQTAASKVIIKLNQHLSETLLDCIKSNINVNTDSNVNN